MKLTGILCSAAVAIVLSGAAWAKDFYLDPGSVAAIAYSPSTGEYHCSYNYRTRKSAEAAALEQCKAPDARIVGWVKFGFIALAVGDNNSWGVGWSYGNGAGAHAADNYALEDCRKRSANAHIVLGISSDGQAFFELSAKKEETPPPTSLSPWSSSSSHASQSTSAPAASPAGFISQMFAGESGKK